MRNAAFAFLSIALLTSACVAGGDNVISAEPADSPVSTIGSAGDPTDVSDPGSSDDNSTSTTAPQIETTTTTTVPERPTGVVTAETVFEPWGDVVGLTMFREIRHAPGTARGRSPETAPTQQWRFPDSPMSGNSPVGNKEKWWSGTGWTGQPLVHVRDDGKTEVVFGAYDKTDPLRRRGHRTAPQA